MGLGKTRLTTDTLLPTGGQYQHPVLKPLVKFNPGGESVPSPGSFPPLSSRFICQN
ncbi:hypothetical protein D082_22810 [Synechocystis sp. PCC 6714]|nr:hypothetical protein D082_22810 [Synechocystis sp. PCC 6714]